MQVLTEKELAAIVQELINELDSTDLVDVVKNYILIAGNRDYIKNQILKSCVDYTQARELDDLALKLENYAFYQGGALRRFKNFYSKMHTVARQNMILHKKPLLNDKFLRWSAMNVCPICKKALGSDGCTMIDTLWFHNDCIEEKICKCEHCGTHHVSKLMVCDTCLNCLNGVDAPAGSEYKLVFRQLNIATIEETTYCMYVVTENIDEAIRKLAYQHFNNLKTTPDYLMQKDKKLFITGGFYQLYIKW